MDLRQRIGSRIKEMRNGRHLTLEAVAKHSNGQIKKARLSNWEQGRSMPGPEEAALLGQILTVSPAYLLCLTDEGGSNDRPSISQIPLFSEQDKALITNNKARIDTKHVEQRLPISEELCQRISENSFAYRLSDNSMSPKAYEDDIIVIDPDKKPLPQHGVLAYFAKNDSLLFRRYIIKDFGKNGTDIFELLPLNTDWPTLNTAEHGQVKIIGTVVQILSHTL